MKTNTKDKETPTGETAAKAQADRLVLALRAAIGNRSKREKAEVALIREWIANG